MKLTIPSSKTDPFRRGIKLPIAASDDSGCPVHAMQQFLDLDTHRGQHSPLFCIGQSSQQAFTRDYVMQRLQNLPLIAGLKHNAWNGHSFFPEAATCATETGLSKHKIQTLGQWKSEAYKAYIESSEREQITLSKRFQTSRDSTH